MPNNKTNKFLINRNDTWRTVLTETTPFELPIIISNDGFYLHLHKSNELDANSKRIFDALIQPGAKNKRTKPYKFRIVKDELSFRELSLLSPKAQVCISEFYEKYSELICYYCSKSSFSMRFPRKTGSIYYTPSKNSNSNKYRSDNVDSITSDQTVKNPASYFAYSGFQQLHQFFSSANYIQLEKRYAFSSSMDVQRCFDSIYTHSISWAIKGKDLAKKQADRNTFGGEFDRLMQDFNWGETNGICIGPEISRIFSEVIFSEIDLNIEKSLETSGYHLRENYDCRRYVDNYYFFADSHDTLLAIQRCLSSELKKYNLHLNDSKTEIMRRPFYTPKSRAISSINGNLGAFFDKIFFTTRNSDDVRVTSPRHIIRYRSVFNDFVNNTKDSCFSAGIGYDGVSNYILGALRRWMLELIESYEKIDVAERPSEEDYERAILLLLDLSFYFLSLHPTVPSSLRVCHSVVLTSRFIKNNNLSFAPHFQERLLRWTNQLIKTPVFSKLFTHFDVIPVELWNVILCLSETQLPAESLKAIISKVEERSSHGAYFRTISELYIYKDDPTFSFEKNQTIINARRFLASSTHLSEDSAHVHLLLDLLACPYLSEQLKVEILSENWASIDGKNGTLPSFENCSLPNIVKQLGRYDWFVSWEGIDLLRMIEKRELSRVYA